MPEYPFRWITENLAVGYAPRSPNDLETIREFGIKAILNLCAECYDLHETEEKAGFDVYYLPIPDEDAPGLDELQKALAWVEDTKSAGKKILVHCRFGIGRTGTFVAAYLISKGHSVRSAIRKMRHTPSTPMSHPQWALIDAFSEKIGVSKAGISELEAEIEVPSNSFFKKWEALLDWFNN